MEPRCLLIGEWTKKMGYIYNGILLSHEEGNIAICDNMDGSKEYYIK